MASGEIEVTPGRVLSETELVDNQKLNDLGTPTLRVKQFAITARELADGAINADKLSVEVEAQLGVSDNSVTTNKIVDGAVTPNKMSEEARIPSGSIMDFAGANAPSGWLLCGGQAVSRTTYAALFTAIGTLWGAGDGSTTFNVPDLRGYVTAGKDDMATGAAGRLTAAWFGGGGGGPAALGGFGGGQSHILAQHEAPQHQHAFSGSGSISCNGEVVRVIGGGIGGGGPYGNAAAVFGGSCSVSGATDFRGSSLGHMNIQPTRIVNKIIRAV